MIMERVEEYGVPIEQVVCCGGIAEKNALLMQIYADVTGREMRVARSAQACALGAAIAASVIAGPERGGHPDFPTAQAAMAGLKDVIYRPDPARRAIYDELFALYRRVHDAFGGVAVSDLGDVMKELLRIKSAAHPA